MTATIDTKVNCAAHLFGALMTNVYQHTGDAEKDLLQRKELLYEALGASEAVAELCDNKPIANETLVAEQKLQADVKKVQVYLEEIDQVSPILSAILKRLLKDAGVVASQSPA